jgi:hypothetical protein
MTTDAASLRPALQALRRAKGRHARVRPHRALIRLEAGPYLLQAVILPAALCALLLRFEPQLVDFWREFILTWAQALDLPLARSAREAGWGEVPLVWRYFDTGSVLPGDRDLLLHALATAAVFAATFAMGPEKLPFKYLLRVLCVLHATALLFFVASPTAFPYDVSDHLVTLTGGGFVLLMTIPVMLALGHYVLRIPLAMKVAHSALILLYFVVLIPLLFFGFGALLNFVLFIALYSWAASTT